MPCQRLFLNPVSADSPQELQLVSETESPFAALKSRQDCHVYPHAQFSYSLYPMKSPPSWRRKLNSSPYSSQDFSWSPLCTLPQQFSSTVAGCKDGLPPIARSSAAPHLVTFRRCRWMPPSSADFLNINSPLLVIVSHIATSN